MLCTTWVRALSLKPACMDLMPGVLLSRCARVCVLSHVLLWDPMDCSSPGSSVHGILQARILEWIAVSSSRGSLQLNIIKAIILTSLLVNPLKILRGMGCKTREVLLEENWEDLSHVYGVTLSSTQKAGIQGPFLVEGMKAPRAKDWWWLKRMSQFLRDVVWTQRQW